VTVSTKTVMKLCRVGLIGTPYLKNFSLTYEFSILYRTVIFLFLKSFYKFLLSTLKNYYLIQNELTLSCFNLSFMIVFQNGFSTLGFLLRLITCDSFD